MPASWGCQAEQEHGQPCQGRLWSCHLLRALCCSPSLGSCQRSPGARLAVAVGAAGPWWCPLACDGHRDQPRSLWLGIVLGETDEWEGNGEWHSAGVGFSSTYTALTLTFTAETPWSSASSQSGESNPREVSCSLENPTAPCAHKGLRCVIISC